MKTCRTLHLIQPEVVRAQRCTSSVVTARIVKRHIGFELPRPGEDVRLVEPVFDDPAQLRGVGTPAPALYIRGRVGTAGHRSVTTPVGVTSTTYRPERSSRLTPRRRPDRFGLSDSVRRGSGMRIRSISSQGSSRPCSQSQTLRMVTPSGRSESFSTSAHAMGTAIGAAGLALTE